MLKCPVDRCWLKLFSVNVRNQSYIITRSSHSELRCIWIGQWWIAIPNDDMHVSLRQEDIAVTPLMTAVIGPLAPRAVGV